MVAPSNRYTAAAPATGYLYQCRYALYLMLRDANEQPTLELSIEKFDDIAFERDGEPTELLQAKHHLGRPPDLSDASVDLWKTIRVWADTAASVNAATLFTIVTTATAAEGSAARLLRPGKGRDVAAALAILRRAAAGLRNAETKAGRDAFLSLASDRQLDLFKRVRVMDSSPNILQVGAEVRRQLFHAAPRGRTEALQSRLEGWWFGEVIRRLAGETTAPMSAVALGQALDDIRSGLERDSLPIDFKGKRPPDGREHDDFVYVKQLQLIDTSVRQLGWAKVDYYRAFAQRSRWLGDELIALDKLEDYDSELEEEWDRRRAKHEYDSALDTDGGAAAKSWGKDLYNSTQERCVSLQGCTEGYVSRGSYQMLADDRRVGWHPYYEKLLPEPPREDAAGAGNDAIPVPEAVSA